MRHGGIEQRTTSRDGRERRRRRSRRIRGTVGWLVATIVLGLGSLAAGAALPQDTGPGTATLDRFAWLEGEWERAVRGGTAIERWSPVPGVGLAGTAVVQPAAGGDEVFTEALLLAQLGPDVFYVAKPRENDYPTGFRLVSYQADEAVFENPTHDFPQRIVYRRTGADSMIVTISDIPDEGEPRSIDFAFERR